MSKAQLPSTLPELFGSPVSHADYLAKLIGCTLADIEREFVLQTLRFYLGNRTRAARALG